MKGITLDMKIAAIVESGEWRPLPAKSLPYGISEPYMIKNEFPREDSFVLWRGEMPVYFAGHCNDCYTFNGLTVPQCPIFSCEIEGWEHTGPLIAEYRIELSPSIKLISEPTYPEHCGTEWVAREPITKMLRHHAEPLMAVCLLLVDMAARGPNGLLALEAGR